MLNLKKYFNKCGISVSKELELEYSNRLLLEAIKTIYKNIKLDNAINYLNAILEIQLSLHPLEIIGCLYIMDKIDEISILKHIKLNSVADYTYFNHIETTLPKLSNLLPMPRTIILLKIINNMFVYKEYKNNINLLIDTAQLIEKSCYCATINNCRTSDDPPPRNWESLSFIEIYYSARCGIILRLLSQNSSSCKEFGFLLVNKLLNGQINPSDVGFMNESEICPESQELEKIDIKKRMDVKIEEKTSNLYQCPSCKERKCTYTTVQKRSLDEASGVSCKCTVCKYKFFIA
jgi:DNA-directed RNA polymerase subunit M/transcription elongation factor TFIIS